jgi:hypothetical protein
MIDALHLGLEQSLTRWEWVDYIVTSTVLLGVAAESLNDFAMSAIITPD